MWKVVGSSGVYTGLVCDRGSVNIRIRKVRVYIISK